MADMANIVVKKNDDTTDITFSKVTPSSGDTVQAVWKSQTVGTAPSHQPEFKLSARDASNGTKRALHAVFTYPQIATDSSTSLVSVINRVSFSADWTVPKDMTTADINEAVSQFANLLDSVLIKDSVKSGYAPT